MPEFVVDASALLAYLRSEPGGETVASAIAEPACALSTINLAEVLSKLANEGANPAAILMELESLEQGLEIVAPTPDDAVSIARLRPLTRDAGLSLGDRACLALALRLGVPALTTDRAWDRIDSGVEVRQLRN